MELLFIIPMKDPRLGKTRLADVLPDEVRARLALALFRQMLGFLANAQPALDVLVVSDSIQIESESVNASVRFLQQSGVGLNQAVEQGAEWAKLNGYSRICVLPADLADPSENDLERLLSVTNGVVLAPAHDGGTNALLATPTDDISFHYGKDSCKAHQKAAELAGLPCTIIPLESFKYDIDTSADLARVRGLKWA